MRRFLLNLAGPALVIGGFYAWASRPVDPTPSKVVLDMDAALAETHPELVAVGPSVAARDLDFRTLPKSLGLTGGVALAMDGSGPAHWYAMLKYRLFDPGYRPKLVLVVTPLRMALQAGPVGSRALPTLVQHYREPDELLAKKALGYAHSPPVERMLRRRASVTRGLVDPLRGALVGLLFGPDHAPASGEGVQEEAAATVFRAATGKLGGERVLPVVEEEPTPLAADAEDVEGLLPDILDLVRASGARAVVVRVPLSEHVRSLDQLSPAEELRGIATINAHGAGYLDLRDAVTSNADFGDSFHVNRSGRLHLSAALVEGLKRIGALGEGPLAAAALPIVPTLSLTGAPPPLPEVALVDVCHGRVSWPNAAFGALDLLGVLDPAPLVVMEDSEVLQRGRARDSGCVGGWTPMRDALLFSANKAASAVSAAYTLAPPEDPTDAWWIAPGTSLRAAFSGAWDRGEFSADVQAAAVGAGAAPTLRLEGGPSVPLAGPGDGLTAQLRAPAPAGPWALSVAVPPDGAWVLLRGLSVGEGANRVAVAGPPLHDRTITRETFRCEGAVTFPTPVLHAGPDPWLNVAGLPEMGAALDSAANQRNLAPFEVVREGTLLTRGEAPAPGVYALVEGRLRLDPADASGAFAVRPLADERARFGRWLLPGERCSLAVEPRHSHFAVRSVLVSATRASEAEGALHIRLEDDAGALLDGTAPWETLSSLAQFALPSWRARPFRLVLSVDPGGPYVFVRSLVLTDSLAGL